MTVFMVERELKGITMEQLAAAQKRAIAVSQKFTDSGKSVRYIRSIFVPGEDRSMCLFEATDAAIVEDVNQDADPLCTNSRGIGSYSLNQGGRTWWKTPSARFAVPRTKRAPRSAWDAALALLGLSLPAAHISCPRP